jgi:hypothetical protein
MPGELTAIIINRAGAWSSKDARMWLRDDHKQEKQCGFLLIGYEN